MLEPAGLELLHFFLMSLFKPSPYVMSPWGPWRSKLKINKLKLYNAGHSPANQGPTDCEQFDIKMPSPPSFYHQPHNAITQMFILMVNMMLWFRLPQKLMIKSSSYALLLYEELVKASFNMHWRTRAKQKCECPSSLYNSNTSSYTYYI